MGFGLLVFLGRGESSSSSRVEGVGVSVGDTFAAGGSCVKVGVNVGVKSESMVAVAVSVGVGCVVLVGVAVLVGVNVAVFVGVAVSVTTQGPNGCRPNISAVT